MKRLDHLPTLRIDTARERALTFDGRSYRGYAGDTLATALFAGGVRIFGRSLKYHRPRGLYSLDGECSNTCVAVDGIPNVRAMPVGSMSAATIVFMPMRSASVSRERL